MNRTRHPWAAHALEARQRGLTLRECAAVFGVSVSRVWEVVRDEDRAVRHELRRLAACASVVALLREISNG